MSVFAQESPILNKQNAVKYVLCLAIVIAPAAMADLAAVGIQITQCKVYSDRDSSLQHDCLEHAAKACNGKDSCELPIGMNLSDGKDLDNNDKTWERVKVEYSCAGKPHINGPHYQNDHATMSLSCHY